MSTRSSVISILLVFLLGVVCVFMFSVAYAQGFDMRPTSSTPVQIDTGMGTVTLNAGDLTFPLALLLAFRHLSAQVPKIAAMWTPTIRVMVHDTSRDRKIARMLDGSAHDHHDDDHDKG